MLSSFINTINTELSKKENKELLDNLYTKHLYPYEYKIYIILSFIFILLILSCVMQGYLVYHVYDSSILK
jgi:hypothetical protein